LDVRPYAALSRQRAVILQGRTQTGKTTLLRTAIPRAHRWNIFGMKWLCWYGIYLNGADARRNDHFQMWVTSQMFGIATAAGSELKARLWEWRQSHWFRSYMEILRMPVLLPRPVYIVVDQFEELMRRFPGEALCWADAVTNYHTRNNLARVIFVVNSDFATQSLLNLDWQGSRYNVVKIDPMVDAKIPAMSLVSKDLFKDCGCNIGIYTEVQRLVKRQCLERTQVPRFVKERLARYNLDFEVSFPEHFHPSWLHLPLPDAKQEVVRALECLLKATLSQEQHCPKLNDGEVAIQTIMQAVRASFLHLDGKQFYLTTQAEWREALANRLIAKPRLDLIDAVVVAKHIKRVMGHPVGWMR